MEEGEETRCEVEEEGGGEDAGDQPADVQGEAGEEEGGVGSR